MGTGTRIREGLVDELMEQFRAEGIDMLGDGGLIPELMKRLLERALDEEGSASCHMSNRHRSTHDYLHQRCTPAHPHSYDSPPRQTSIIQDLKRDGTEIGSHFQLTQLAPFHEQTGLLFSVASGSAKKLLGCRSGQVPPKRRTCWYQ